MSKRLPLTPDGALEMRLGALLRDLVRAEIAAAAAAVPQPEPEAADYLTTRMAAAYASVAPGTLRRWIREGRLSTSRIGRYYRVKRADLDRLRCAAADDDDAGPEELARAAFGAIRVVR